MPAQRTIQFLFLIAVALALPFGRAKAAAPTPPETVVWIEPIADSGGAGEKTSDGETLARRFTKGLRTALEAESKDRFEVRIAAPLVSAAPPTVRYVLRGGLSRVQGDDSENQPYLCIVRLFQESIPAKGKKMTRHLVGQWSGTARGLRDLTGNLSRDPRVPVLGLAGALSQRVSVAAVRCMDKSAASPAPADESAAAVLLLEGGSSVP